jgi:hypothetical protein
MGHYCRIPEHANLALMQLIRKTDGMIYFINTDEHTFKNDNLFNDMS